MHVQMKRMTRNRSDWKLKRADWTLGLLNANAAYHLARDLSSFVG